MITSHILFLVCMSIYVCAYGYISTIFLTIQHQLRNGKKTALLNAIPNHQQTKYTKAAEKPNI